MSKTIAEFFVFVDFDLYYTESGSPHWGLFEGGAYLLESSSRVRLIQKGLNRVFTVDLYGYKSVPLSKQVWH